MKIEISKIEIKFKKRDFEELFKYWVLQIDK